jgi:hypothetical protein
VTRSTILIAVLLTGCSGLVKHADGERVTIEHDYWTSDEAVRTTAARSCAQQPGKTDAVRTAKAYVNPALAPGIGVQLSTFRCL